jgi:prepilin-type N-terminal cleavage/methylation domain-containing protein
MWRRDSRQAGVTLAEMLVVAAVLALAARIAIPNASPLVAVSARAAGAEILQAIRFAQNEALRTGAWHTVKFDTTAQTLRVYRLTSTGAEDTANPVFHPVDKRRYDIVYGAGGPTRATLTLVDFDYDPANSNLSTLSFGPDGTPALLVGSGDKDIKAMKAGVVTIMTGAGARSFSIDPVTGRVSG